MKKSKRRYIVRASYGKNYDWGQAMKVYWEFADKASCTESDDSNSGRADKYFFKHRKPAMECFQSLERRRVVKSVSITKEVV